MVPGVTSNLEARRIALIHKRLAGSQTSDRLARSEFCHFFLRHFGVHTFLTA